MSDNCFWSHKTANVATVVSTWNVTEIKLSSAVIFNLTSSVQVTQPDKFCSNDTTPVISHIEALELVGRNLDRYLWKRYLLYGPIV